MNSREKSFSGSLGFILTAAGSAVGVGNIWRFPYLAAEDGGGLFIVIYLILFFTLGTALLSTDLALGRRTGQSSIKAFRTIDSRWSFLGALTFSVPLVIMTYYTVIGSWVLKYAVSYITGKGNTLLHDSAFTSFIMEGTEPVVYNLIFLFFTVIVVYKGVEKGVEKFSKIIMPGLIFLIVGIFIYTLTLTYTEGNVTRTAAEGIAIYLKPNLKGMTAERFMKILLDAMSQIFFSLSVSMGIMITFGSYVKDDVDLTKSVRRIQFFDTFVALIAGAIIIPSVYVFSGENALDCGPGLMFISLPKLFADMGKAGNFIAPLFFIMVIFATLTSCISILETIVANFQEITGHSRKRITIRAGLVYAVLSTIICMGYTRFYMDISLPDGSTAQLLDLMDYIANSCLLPFIAFLSSIFISHIAMPEYVTEEMEKGAEEFKRKKAYGFTMKYVTPAVMIVLFVKSTGCLNLIF